MRLLHFTILLENYRPNCGGGGGASGNGVGHCDQSSLESVGGVIEVWFSQ